MSPGTNQSAHRPHIVIVGGGFGGITAARQLRRQNVDITLIDRHTYNTFQPLLYQVATASLNPGDITWFLRALRTYQSNVQFLKGTVVSMDHDAKTVQLDNGAHVEYDQLVIAVGATTNFFGVPGAAEHAHPLYRRSQALAVRDQMFAHLEDAAINGMERELRIIVVGGGATGVETAGAFAEMRNIDMPTTYPELDPAHTHITLVEMLPHVLAPFHPNLREYARKSLIKRSVDLRLNTAVKEVRDDGVVVENEDGQEFLQAGLVVWASGITAGEMWRARMPDGSLAYSFLQSLIAIKPFYVTRWLGGCLILTGMFVMAGNMWISARNARREGVKPVPVPIPEPDPNQHPAPLPPTSSQGTPEPA